MATVWLLLTTLTAACGVAAAEPRPGETVDGPEWKSTLRMGVGAATTADPALLRDVIAEEHGAYDRVIFTFEGERPGYRVGYDAHGDGLRIELTHARLDGERRETPRLAAVDEINVAPVAEGRVDTVVSLHTDAEHRLPFRIGLSIGAFYVDIAHPAAGNA